ncbi:MAG TPA: DUF4162 domain-containing protein [Nitrososphaerales archaeon]|nr:DUF4162 domain-containing protein [Nitrososphaerales archaeon]
MKKIESVVKVVRVGSSYRMKVVKAEAALPTIIASITARGLKIKGISYNKPTLDEVFLEVTGRSMRDADEAGGGITPKLSSQEVAR